MLEKIKKKKKQIAVAGIALVVLFGALLYGGRKLYFELPNGMDTLFKAYLLFALVSFAAFVFSIVIVKNKRLSKNKHVWLALIVLIFGGIYSALFPIYMVPDEPVHMYSAYNLSSEWLGYEPSYSVQYIRSDDLDHSRYLRINQVDRSYMDVYFQDLQVVRASSTDVVETTEFYSLNDNFTYWPSALGITLARLAGLGSILTLEIGRLFNLLLFCISLCFSIKFIPIGKEMLFVWAMFPITLQQVMSYSYDSVIFSCSCIIVALTLRAWVSKTRKEILAFGIVDVAIAVLLFFAKSHAFFPLSMWAILMCLYRYIFNETHLFEWIAKHRKKIAIAIMCVCVALIVLGVAYVRRLPDEGAYVDWAQSSAVSLKYIITHPMYSFNKLFFTLFQKGDFYSRSMVGDLGWFELQSPLIITMPILACFVAGCMREEKETETIVFNGWTKVFTICCMLLGCAIPVLAMWLYWTPIEYSWIEGVQGRYFLPFILLAVVILSFSHIKVSSKMKKALIPSVVFLEVIECMWLFYRF